MHLFRYFYVLIMLMNIIYHSKREHILFWYIDGCLPAFLFTIASLHVSDNFPVSPGVYILIGAGSLVMLVGFFGCCGAVRESQCLLGSVSTNAHKHKSKKLN